MFRVWRTGDWKEEAVVKEPFQVQGVPRK